MSVWHPIVNVSRGGSDDADDYGRISVHQVKLLNVGGREHGELHEGTAGGQPP